MKNTVHVSGASGFNFYAPSNDVNVFCDATLFTVVVQCDSPLQEIFPPGYYKLYVPQKLLMPKKINVLFLISSPICHRVSPIFFQVKLRSANRNIF